MSLRLPLIVFLCTFSWLPDNGALQAATAEGEHSRMMERLGIDHLRPGKNGWDKDTANPPNYDEAMANPYPDLPPLMVMEDGSPVNTPEQWINVRRPELKELFAREIYGRVPDEAPDAYWEVMEVKEETLGGIPCQTRLLKGRLDNSECPELEVAIDLTVTRPVDAMGTVPVVLHFGWPPEVLARFPQPPGPTWQEQVVARGWAAANILPTSVQADNGAGLTAGVIGLANDGQPRDPEDWGALRAWAWGASRALDYLEADPAFDGSRVGLEGLSRYGKAVLVAMAFDGRFSLVLVGSSGAGGAKILRRDFGETVENLASSGLFHWMAGNFMKYAGPLGWDDLPVDAHELIALCAPRPVFIGAGSLEEEGGWIDQPGMFMAAVAASPAWELLGGKGLTAVTDEPPVIHEDLIFGDLAWRQHSGGHTNMPNYPVFLDWAARYWDNGDNSGQVVRDATWHADNGNGTFTNPLFYDEFSDPDLIRVGEDYYLTGTTMHTMPGLPVLHSRDLVNWELLAYASKGLDFEPRFRLEDGQDIYGQGIWAPSFRYHDGTFYIFTNVNGRSTQLYTATDPRGPWEHRELNISLHDLSVLFDDDGRIYAVWGYREVRFVELDRNFDIIPGTERVLFAADAGMGEGCHFYKIDGKYYLTSAWFAGRMRMPCARADKPEGPYEVNPEISADEEFGIIEGYRLPFGNYDSMEVLPPNPDAVGRMSLHQGGIVDTPSGEWWGFSMMDYNSVGRLTCLSPVTWKDGWPYFGLPGNLGRTPRTWLKPDTGHDSPPSAPYQRDDAFNGPELANVWQWNHHPVDEQWSLEERPGFLRLRALPSADFWRARGTLTQRAIGPKSSPVAELETAGLEPGDLAGLALLNYPYAWIGVARNGDGYEIRQYDQLTGKTATAPFGASRIWLRADCDFMAEKANFSYSLDGKNFQQLGDPFTMVFQLRTFQGIRYSLFCYNNGEGEGGYADFAGFRVDEPEPSGFTRPIPAGKDIVLQNRLDASVLAARGDWVISVPKTEGDPTARFRVIGLAHGRVAFEAVDGRRVTVTGPGNTDRVALAPARPGNPAQTFQWTEMPHGQILLLSLSTHRHLCIQPDGGMVTATATGVEYDNANGASFDFEVMDAP